MPLSQHWKVGCQNWHTILPVRIPPQAENTTNTTKCLPDVILGCQWSEWTAWSECTKTCGGGNVKRVREKLPGLGTCDGASEEITLCDNEVCPLENDANSLAMVIGGETVASRENEHSTSIEIIGPNGLFR